MMLVLLYVLTALIYQCVSGVDTVEELIVQAICQARCLQSDIECDFYMEDCIGNLTSNLLESDYNFTNGSFMTEDIQLGAVKLVCRNDNLLVVKWQQTPRLVYVVEQQMISPQDSITKWEPINITVSETIELYGLETNTSYQIKVRGFAAEGQVGKTMFSDILSTTSAEESFLEPVSNITLTEITVWNKKIHAMLQWTPSPDLPCSYEVVVWPQKPDMSSHYEILYSYKTHKTKLPPLEFNTKYSIRVRAQTILQDGSEKESNQTSLEFTTQGCLDFYSRNLSVCSPEEPSNVTANEILNKKNESLCEIHIFWSKPRDMPLFYTIMLEMYNDNYTEQSEKEIIGNRTTAVFKELANFSNIYSVIVTAVSPGGQSQTKINKWSNNCLTKHNHGRGNLPVFWMTVLVMLSIFVLLLSLTMFHYHRKKRKANLRKKSIYFQEDLKKSSSSYVKNCTENKTSEEADEFEIQKEHIIICDLLGEGAFGIVHKGLLNNNIGPPQEIAIKMLQESPSAEEFQQFLKEIEVMKSVGKHKHIVSLIGCCTQGTQLLLVIEYCALGDLQNYLRQEWKKMSTYFDEKNREIHKNNDVIKYADLMPLNSNGSYRQDMEVQMPCVFNEMYGAQDSKQVERRLTPADLLAFARQIAIGMEHLSNNKVIHRDLAARNVLVCSDLTLKISDFGLSKDIYEQSIYRKKESEKLPIKWMALESLMHQVYTTQSDIWSFGILLWEIVTLGGNPYPSIPTNQMFRLLKHGYRMERPPSCSMSLYNIMLSCWKANPKSRPSFAVLVEKLDELLETCSPHEYLNLELISDHYDEIWESSCSSDGSTSVQS